MKDDLAVTCIICQQNVPFTDATAGALYADGRQAFACLEHTWNKASWLLAWARFSIEQQEYSMQEKDKGVYRKNERVVSC